MEHPALSRRADAGLASSATSSSAHRAAPSATSTTRPGPARPWRAWLPGGDVLLAWLAAVAAVTVFIDFAATF